MRSHAYGGEEQMKAEAERKSRIQSSKICGFSRNHLMAPKVTRKMSLKNAIQKRCLQCFSQNGKKCMSPGCHAGYSHSRPPPSIPMPSESKSVFRIRQARITSLRLLGSLLAKRPTKCAAFQEAWWWCHRWSRKSHTQTFHTMYILYIYILYIYINWHMTYTLYRMKICSEPSMITNVWNTTMLHLLLNAPWGCRFNFDCPSWLLKIYLKSIMVRYGKIW